MENMLRGMRFRLFGWLRGAALALFAAGFAPQLFAAPGDIDATFGVRGWRVVEEAEVGWAVGLALDPGGNSYTAATVCTAHYCRLAVLKLDANGNRANGFGAEGMQIFDLSGTGHDRAGALALDSSGNVYVAGSAGLPGGIYPSQFGIVKLDGSGNPVPTFGVGGKVVLPLPDGLSPTSADASAIALDAHGNIYVAGNENSNSVVFKLDGNGSPVTGFGVAGKATIGGGIGGPTGVNALIIDARGNSYLAGRVTRPGSGFIGRPQFALFKLDADGNGAAGFGAGGRKLIDLDASSQFDGFAGALALDETGNIIAAGTTGDFRKFVVVKADVDGNPVAGFGVDGKRVIDVGSHLAANGIALDRRGNIIVAGGGESRSVVLQLDPAGSLMVTFGSGGMKFLSEADGIAFVAKAIAIDAGDRLVLAGSGDILVGNTYQPHVALTRLHGGAVALLQQSGWWWNPAEDGRGFFLETNAAGRIFFASYLYAVNGRATWYASSLGYGAGAFAGTLDAYGGGQTLAGAYQPPVVSVGAGGSINLSFSDATHGVLAWAGGTTPIERFVFADDSAPPAFQPQRGWWWHPAESGRGFSLEVQGSTVFLSGYMYAADGSPIWYLSSGSLVDRSYQGSWTEYANGQTLGGPYQPPAQINADAGAVSIIFSSPVAGLMTLPDGRRIEIVRFVF